MSRQPGRPLSAYSLVLRNPGTPEKKVKKNEKKACVSGNVCYSESEERGIQQAAGKEFRCRTTGRKTDAEAGNVFR